MFLLVCFGCGDESSNQDEIVQDSVEDEIVVETEPKKDIVWKKDGKEMILIPAGSPLRWTRQSGSDTHYRFIYYSGLHRPGDGGESS